MSARALKEGDVVEILRFKLEGALVREVWVPARVLGVSDEGNVAAEALRAAAFDEQGHNRIVLHGRMRGTSWR